MTAINPSGTTPSGTPTGTTPPSTVAQSDSQTDSSKRSPTRDIALIAAFAALISASTYIGDIPVGAAGVPLTLQTLTVMLAGCILGPVRGSFAVLLYLALGLVGLPVFAGHSSGPGVFAGPSGGYLVAFPFAAALGGFLVKYVARDRRTRALVIFACSITASILIIHPLGIIGFMLYFKISFLEAGTIDTAYWLGDVLKTSLVAMIAAEVHRAFPQLLQRD